MTRSLLPFALAAALAAASTLALAQGGGGGGSGSSAVPNTTGAATQPTQGSDPSNPNGSAARANGTGNSMPASTAHKSRRHHKASPAASAASE